jgi:hypothetical protein
LNFLGLLEDQFFCTKNSHSVEALDRLKKVSLPST